MKSGLPTIPFLTHRDRNFSKMLMVHVVFKAFANSAKSKVLLIIGFMSEFSIYSTIAICDW